MKRQDIGKQRVLKRSKWLRGMGLVMLMLCAWNGAMGQTPTTITDVAGLNAMTATGNYVIDADIDASGFNSSISSFSGTMEANINPTTKMPYRIKNLNVPLFTTLTGTVKNLVLEDVNISGNSGNTGAIACTANGAARIYNVGILSGEVGGTAYTGGLVGLLDGTARVVNCYSFATITGGTDVGGIVGYNNQGGATQDNYATKTIVVNCMFYGDVTGGTSKRPVYGGNIIANNASNGVNNYNYFLSKEGMTLTEGLDEISKYNNSWPVAEKYLKRFEFYRSILNSNRRLCTWWINGTSGTAPTDEDVAAVGIAKWVLDPSVAPYPILKRWDKYPSVINIDPENVWNPRSQAYVARSNANRWEGKSVGTLQVTINAGSYNNNAVESRNLVVTDMDTLGYDYCAYKIQLPYYNEIFGDPESDDHATRYGNNYTAKVVTGWKITKVNGSTTGTGPEFVEDWQTGYDFADRTSTKKDLFSVSGRVFAQGGYYYVPDDVESIEIEAYWGKAVYLCNNNRRLDRVNNGTADFSTAGQLPSTIGGQTVKTSLSAAVGALDIQPNKTVYDQAIVLVGNYQQNDFHNNITLNGSQYSTKAKPFTIMSADFDFDNEPDFCFQAGMSNAQRVNSQPIRFDFLPVPDITMAIRMDNKYFGMRIFCPQGHFEITETAFMYTTQFEYDTRPNNASGYLPYHKTEAPVILNGGEFFQIVSSENGANNQNSNPSTALTWGADKTSYFILGGRLWMKAFTPGVHGNSCLSTRHCAVNAIGGEFQEFYLSGMFRTDFYNKTDNPHCYTDGGKFGLVAGAGMESVGGMNETNGGDVTFRLNHSLVSEFYGGGINDVRPVTGNIHVTCDNSIVHKYCGGPKLGNMSNQKTITNLATGSIFGWYYGGGNGGTNMLRDRQYDSGSAHTPPDAAFWNGTGRFTAFTPFAYNVSKGYQTEYEFELLPQPNGNSTVVIRSYYHWASFSHTEVAPVTTTLADCTVRHNFYGGGYLGSVGGDVVSTLTDTHVYGSAYGGGFSASIPSFPVHDKSTVNYAYSDYAGYIHDGSLDYRKYSEAVGDHQVGDTIYFEWINAVPSYWGVSPSTSNPTFQYPANSGKWYCYTTETLTNLGTINGNTTLTIEGNSTIHGSVFGGGDESVVNGNTLVKVLDQTKVFGNVYGGGNMGEVGGNTKVIINGQQQP